MFDNLTMEIIYYSLVPVVVIAIVGLFLLILYKKSEKNKNKYSYGIKISLVSIISLVLPLIIGYTIWLVKRYVNKGTIFSNIGFVIVLVLLIIALIVLLVTVCKKLYKRKSD